MATLFLLNFSVSLKPLEKVKSANKGSLIAEVIEGIFLCLLSSLIDISWERTLRKEESLKQNKTKSLASRQLFHPPHGRPFCAGS